MQPAGDRQMLAKPPFPKKKLCYVDTADCLHWFWLLAGDWPLRDTESWLQGPWNYQEDAFVMAIHQLTASSLWLYGSYR